MTNTYKKREISNKKTRKRHISRGKDIDWTTILQKVYSKNKDFHAGHNADYIPALKNVDPNLYGISVFTIEGDLYEIGDTNTLVAIESVSKIFSLALALKKHGISTVLKKIGNEQSYDPFNSIKAIEKSNIHTLNSFDNGGAMATTSLSYISNRRSFEKRIYDEMSAFASRKLSMSKPIYKSEIENADHNRALAHLLASYGRFYAPVEETVDAYTRQCSALVTTRDIAIMASTLANGGVNPKTGKKLLDRKQTDYILEHMIRHGMYEMSDKWAKQIGYPAKSGVGGIILIVIPGIAGIGIVSPPLTKDGNSAKGIKTVEKISRLL
jgi:glutaminase